MKSFLRVSRAAGAAAVLITGAASAAPVVTEADIDFAGSSVSFGYLGTQYTFSDMTRYFFDTDPITVTTEPGAMVSSLGLPFYDPPQPTTFFDPIRGSGELVFDASSQYSSFTGVRIPTSLFPSIIGLALTLQDGVHYGYARFDNTFLSSYGFESTPGVGFVVTNVAAVPEPETWALMAACLGMLGGASLRGRRRSDRGRAA